MVDIPRTNLHLNWDNELLLRFQGINEIKLAMAYLKYRKGGKVQKILHELKYRDCPQVGTLLGNWYGNDLENAGFKKLFDLILPIPLHPLKLKRRGYNQSDSFAAGLSQSLGIELSLNGVSRIKNNDTQTHRSRMERWRNVDNIFRVGNPELILGKRILLVDDIVTTGATLGSCARTLLSSGCAEVSVATIAIA